jgi:hypothetical protein
MPRARMSEWREPLKSTRRQVAPSMSQGLFKMRLSKMLGDDARELIPRLLATDGRKHAWGYARAFFFMALIAATTGLAAYMMKHVVDRIFVEGNYAMVWVLGGMLMAIFTVKGLATYGQMVTLAKIGNRIIADYQRRIYDTLAGGIRQNSRPSARRVHRSPRLSCARIGRRRLRCRSDRFRYGCRV